MSADVGGPSIVDESEMAMRCERGRNGAVDDSVPRWASKRRREVVEGRTFVSGHGTDERKSGRSWAS